ncbi:uncharacterized protein LOC111127074 [Crassostrea virginica]|uniref:Uncharacterized protein LOC111127074 n=1 Tax=Crassostrea virginica TaxID=6565 RepID=A0A8B8DI28_CRAVI|nr:uncharacterized protein LOC111127074 [Crassostrea virginica]
MIDLEEQQEKFRKITRDLCSWVFVLKIILMVAAIMLIFFSEDISNEKQCELQTAIEFIHLKFYSFSCEYSFIKELSESLCHLGKYVLWLTFSFCIALLVCQSLLLTDKNAHTSKIAFSVVVVCALVNVILLYFMVHYSNEILVERQEQKNIDYIELQKSMLLSLEKHYYGDDIIGSNDNSSAWNLFFIKYDCCAVREIQGTANDFDNTPWCTTSGSCQATSSQIPRTCCKDVTQDDYQNAPAMCHASVNPGTYRQGCLARMKSLSTVNIDEFEVLMLSVSLYTLWIFQLLELILEFLYIMMSIVPCLVLRIRRESHNMEVDVPQPN